MKREIVLVRHGEAYNTVKPDGLRPVLDPANPPLTPRGEAQAVATALAMCRLVPDMILLSPFLRVAQTAFAYLCLSDTIGLVDVRLGEHFAFPSLKHFHGINLTDYRARFSDRLRFDADLATSQPFPRFPESDASVDTRVRSLFRDLVARKDWTRAGLYGHGATVGALSHEMDSRVAFAPRHCSITRFVEESRGVWRPLAVNDVSHLPGE